MADNEREELHKTIWSMANDLRGSVDGWDFKSYVLGILFYRYISENLTNYINKNEHESGNTNFDYAKISDKQALTTRDDIISEKGYFILPSQLFENVNKKASKDQNLNKTLDKVFKYIEKSTIGHESEKDFKGLFSDLDVNNKEKLGDTIDERNEKLANILNRIGDLKLGDFKDNSIDAFGDAYEYLMSMYASNAGKSGGEFFTPQEVGELLARISTIGKTQVNKVYDPACGSGSLLLKFAKILGKENVRNGFYGQDVNPTIYNLCRINMLLHDIDYDKFDIARGDTLRSPKHLNDGPFDAIVSNPPYSVPWYKKDEDKTLLISDERYSPAGVLAPKKKGDMAFILHSIHCLSTDGTAAIVCFPGIFYRTGAEQKIRKYLVTNNYIDAIIQLPANLFYGTPITTCILVMKKSKIDNNILFIDASKEFIKDGAKNKLTSENISNIIKLYTDRNDVDYIAKVVSAKEIEDNEYNLYVPTYVKVEDTREIIDIELLNKQIKDFVKKEDALRIEIDDFIKDFGDKNNE